MLRGRSIETESLTCNYNQTSLAPEEHEKVATTRQNILGIKVNVDIYIYRDPKEQQRAVLLAPRIRFAPSPQKFRAGLAPNGY